MVGIRFVGSGGQGVILAGQILGKAAAIYESKEAVYTETYGAETRGGYSSSALIISDEKIDYPYVLEADILVAFSQKGYDTAKNTLNKNGILIYEEDLVKPEMHEKSYSIPATKLVKERFNKTTSMNMTMLGFIVKITNIVKFNSLVTAIAESVPKGTENDNIEAAKLGFEYNKI
ncbi:MAG: 2-oxoacid:acceptor oxidoreductase family protein [Thermoplasmata archaeon]